MAGRATRKRSAPARLREGKSKGEKTVQHVLVANIRIRSLFEQAATSCLSNQLQKREEHYQS